MSSFLLDTNVLSETSRPRPDERVLHWLGGLAQLKIPAVALYELASGIRLLGPGDKRFFLEGWFDELLRSEPVIVPIDADAAFASADVAVLARKQKRHVEHRDLLILGVALSRGLTVSTRNVSHFRGLGVPVYNPFDGSLEA